MGFLSGFLGAFLDVLLTRQLIFSRPFWGFFVIKTCRSFSEDRRGTSSPRGPWQEEKSTRFILNRSKALSFFNGHSYFGIFHAPIPSLSHYYFKQVVKRLSKRQVEF